MSDEKKRKRELFIFVVWPATHGAWVHAAESYCVSVNHSFAYFVVDIVREFISACIYTNFIIIIIYLMLDRAVNGLKICYHSRDLNVAIDEWWENQPLRITMHTHTLTPPRLSAPVWVSKTRSMFLIQLILSVAICCYFFCSFKRD